MKVKKLWKSIVAVFACSALMVSIPANATEDDNAKKLQDGSFAYFEDKEATAALDALNNSKYADLTVRGDASDATSFQNMLDSFQWIKECNRLRELNGLEPLLVNDTLMAMAQADANFSDTEIAHAKQFNVGENCAWNYGSNPFTQWYDDEKKIYDAMENKEWTNETGHYLNIINSSYRTTGFAITTRGTMSGWNTYTQVFSYSDDGIPVEEYEQLVIDYYNSLTANENPDAGDDNTGDNGSTGGDSNTGDNGNTGEDNNTGDNGSTGGDNNTGDNGSTGGDNNTGNNGSTGEDSNNGDNTGNTNSGDNGTDNGNTGSSDSTNSGNTDNSDSEDSTSEISELIANAKSGATIKMTGVTTLSNGDMKELLKKGDVTLVLEYTYKDVNYVVTIPANAAIDNDISWYGPLYLAAHYGNGTSANGVTGSVYTVKAKDTMSKIARANGMTLSQLAAKNPQIKDLNHIRVGQQINLR